MLITTDKLAFSDSLTSTFTIQMVSGDTFRSKECDHPGQNDSYSLTENMILVNKYRPLTALFP